MILLLKLALAPLLTILVTLSTRRWGNAIGGWVAGLPLLAGPISLLLSMQYGFNFAQQAAHGTILGLVGVCAFALCYSYLAEHLAWPNALTLSLLAFFITLGIMHLLAPNFIVSLGILIFALSTCLINIPLIDCKPIKQAAIWWDLPMRIIVVTGLTAAITSAAPMLGEQLSGLISPIPIFTIVFVVIAHQTRTIRAVKRLLRGVVSSLFGFTAFFVIIHSCPPDLGLLLVYLLALMACLTINALSYQKFLKPIRTH